MKCEILPLFLSFKYKLKYFFIKKKFKMSFLETINGLIIKNIDFANDELEAIVEDLAASISASSVAALNFQNAVKGENQESLEKGGKALIDLASDLGTAFSQLTPEQLEKFKSTVADIYENPDPVIDSAASSLFDASLDVVVKGQKLTAFVDSLEG